MKELLLTEWLKIRRYRTFRVLAGLFLVLVFLFNWGIANGLSAFGQAGELFFSKAYSFPEVWGNVAYWSGYLVLILSVLVIILITNEYQFRTHRQNVMDGWRRLDFFHAKAALVLALSVLATVFYALVCLILGLLHGGVSGMGISGMEKILYFFVYTVNYLGFAALLAFWLRRSGLAIGLFLLYALIIENMLSAYYKYALKVNYGFFFPLEVSDSLLPLPLTSLARSVINTGQRPADSIFLILSLAWIAIYYLLARRLFLKRDL